MSTRALSELRRQLLAMQSLPGFQSPGLLSGPVTNTLLRASLGQTQPISQMMTVTGTVTDVVGPARCYRVELSGLRTPITCAPVDLSSTTVHGAKSLASIPVGSSVLVVTQHASNHGWIVAVLPSPGGSARQNVVDMLAASSRARVDDAHTRPVTMPLAGTVVDWNAGRPMDSTTNAEQGWITETGLRILIDSFMSCLAADEASGLFCFYHDRLVRLAAAWNFQLWLPGGSREALNDEGDLYDVEGHAIFPWEQYGLFREGAFPATAVPAEEWQKTAPHKTPLELDDPYAQPWHRHRHFRGCLGQGGLQTLSGSPVSENATHLAYDGGTETPAKLTALYQQWVSSAGRLSIAAAGGFSLLRTLHIRSPRQRRRPEDPAGNTQSSGSAPVVLPPARVPAAVDSSPALQQSASAREFDAFYNSYAAVRGFLSRDKDWDTPEVVESVIDSGSLPTYAPDLAAAREDFLIPPLETVTLTPDAEHGPQDYVVGEAGIVTTPDGGVVIRDAYGNQIRMGPDGISISGPTDVAIRTGRNTIVWGGRDILLRAREHIEAASSTQSVRIKAERNLMLLGGNSGSGGILVENRAVGEFHPADTDSDANIGGLVLKSASAPLTTWSAGVYIRTGGGSDGQAVGSGPITLDADQGRQPLFIFGTDVSASLSGSLRLSFGTSQRARKTTVLSESVNIFSGASQFADAVIINGQVVCKNGLAVARGAVAATTGGLVATLSGQSLDIVERALSEAGQAAATQARQSTLVYQQQLKPLLFDENRPGNNTVISQTAFFFRSSSEYGADKFKLYQDLWQQLSSAADLREWDETTTLDGYRRETMPYPGLTSMMAATYYKPQATFVESSGWPKQTGSGDSVSDTFRSAALNRSDVVALQGNYFVL